MEIKMPSKVYFCFVFLFFIKYYIMGSFDLQPLPDGASSPYKCNPGILVHQEDTGDGIQPHCLQPIKFYSRLDAVLSGTRV